ncbi:MAG TPA: diaminopimelate decarboxylase, partial [Anaerolineae bacterium]|nr:diaminopimelate decarboxylase [Anaerolineae bacterium]
MGEYNVSKRLALFPDTTRIETVVGVERLSIADCDLDELAREHDTPLYLYDQVTLDGNLEAYRQALAASYSGEWGLTYAGKAGLCVALAKWVQQRGLWLDCTGRGELAVAAAAGVERDRILVHGVNKSEADLIA